MVELINKGLTRTMLAVGELRQRFTEERGQGLMEYAVLSGVIAAFIVGLGAALALTGALTGMANGIAECIDFDSVCP